MWTSGAFSLPTSQLFDILPHKLQPLLFPLNLTSVSSIQWDIHDLLSGGSPSCTLLWKVPPGSRVSLPVFLHSRVISPGLPVVCLNVWKTIFFQFSSFFWWGGIMAEVKQYLFSIEVFIAIMILNKWDLRLFIFVVFWVILFSSKTLLPFFFQMKFYNSTQDSNIETSQNFICSHLSEVWSWPGFHLTLKQSGTSENKIWRPVNYLPLSFYMWGN